MRHLLTGAGSGIGRALADAVHARGDDLFLIARSEERAGDLRERYAGATVLVADLADPSSLGRLDLEVDTLDSAVHAAGVVDLGPATELTTEQWRTQIDVNLVAGVELVRLALPALRKGRGTVVLVNSGAGLVAHPGWSAYAASKFALRAFADALRQEEATHGVRVTTVYPGRTATPMQRRVHEQEGKQYAESDWIRAETVAAQIIGVLDLSTDATISDVTVRPGP